MLRLAISTFRDRWPVFVGAIITVAIGVALAESSMLGLLAVVSPDLDPSLSAAEELAIRDQLAAAVTLLALMVAISVFVAFFVVGSTFAFTVTQRTREISLLRLVGARRAQVRRLLLGEAVLLGTIGTAIGVAAGRPLAAVQARILTELDFIPAGFEFGWHPVALPLAAVAGLGVAMVASLGAARRASHLRPLDGLRPGGRADGSMSRIRWLIGLGLVAVAAALVVSGAAGPPDGDPLGRSMQILLVLLAATGALAPGLVPVVGAITRWTTGWLSRRFPVGEIASANLHDGPRHAASMATPVILLAGLTIGFAGSVAITEDGIRRELTSGLDADLVVQADEPIGPELASLDGVDTVSTEVPVRIRLQSDDRPIHSPIKALAVDPEPYQHVHRTTVVEGELTNLDGRSIVLDADRASLLQVAVGDDVTLRHGETERQVTVTAVMAATLGGSDALLPLSAAGPDRFGASFFLQTTDEGASQVKRWAAKRNGIVVSTARVWTDEVLDQQHRVARNTLIAILGLVGIYLLVAVANAAVLASTARRIDYAVVRLVGLTRRQVVASALWEAALIVMIGLALAAGAAAVTLTGTASAVARSVGSSRLDVPWTTAAVVVAAILITLASSTLLATLAATFRPPLERSDGR